MMMGKTCGIHKICWVLLIIGGLNWGLVGAFQYDLVMNLLGFWPWLVRTIYVLVGLAAIAMLFTCGKCCTCRGKGKCDCTKCAPPQPASAPPAAQNPVV
jgi:uncharacterized protein